MASSDANVAELIAAVNAGNVARVAALLPVPVRADAGARFGKPSSAASFKLNLDARSCNADWTRGRTALAVAASIGHTEIARMLLAAGANVNARCVDGWTPMMAAASAVDAGVLRWLLAANGDVHAKQGGVSALMRAARYSRVEQVQLLLDAGANANDKDERGRTALVVAAEAWLGEMAHEALEAGVPVNAAFGWTSTAPREYGLRVAVMRALLRAGAVLDHAWLKAQPPRDKVVLLSLRAWAKRQALVALRARLHARG